VAVADGHDHERISAAGAGPKRRWNTGPKGKDPSALAYGPTQHFVERITDVRGTALQQEQARSLLTKPMALALEERASRRCCGA